jgi:D-beta-D-heptose 7-phosphate kinase/D-beta-D-heptose 1-phosphate adenosyltransferase
MIKVFTNGCFDILHRGHIELFKYAKSLGDVLYVAIDSDSKVRSDKGGNRPINKMEDRMELLSSIKYIDDVFIFHSPFGLENHVARIKPDIMVVGSDWKGKPIIGSEYAGEVKYFDRVGNYSSTSIIEGGLAPND